MADILIIAEHDNAELKASTAATVNAASKIGGNIEVLVAGQGCSAVADAAKALDGVSAVISVDSAEYKDHIAESLADLVIAMAGSYSHILAPATTFGKDFMPRVAAKLDVAQVSDIIAVESEDTFKRPIYAGNAIATVQSTDAKKVITVRPAAFDRAGSGGSAEIKSGSAAGDSGLSAFVKLEASGGDRPDLSAANVVISGGRGVGSKDDFALIEKLADKLGGAVGASRAAVDAGFVPNDYQVGQTGKIVAPDLYIAVGISGAIQHLAGMSGSKVIVAINKDEQAPIFEVADYGLVADLFEAVPELIDKL